MIRNKLVNATVIGLIGITWASVSLASELECDDSCRSSIEFQHKLDSKDMEIMLMQKELSLKRLAEEIRSLAGSDKSSEDVNSVINELKEKIEALNQKFSDEIEKVSVSEADSSGFDIEVVVDTTGIENIFVTETRSVGGDWEAKVFYNNSAQGLYVGEHVFPGAVIESIDRRGMVISLNGENHHKMITPAEVAQARTFNNIREERSLKRDKIELQRQNSGGSSYASPYF